MEPDRRTNEERRRDERRIWGAALLASVLLHLLLLLLFRGDPVFESPFAAAGPRAGDDVAASGSMQAMNATVPPRRPLVPPPVPVPTLDPVEPIDFDEEIAVDASEMLGDGPGPPGPPGLPEGTGEGDGGTAAEGTFTLVPPQPRGMIIPPTSSELKGESVEVWVFVDERGRVVADSTRLRPPTSDGDFNEQIVEEAADWVFRPAQKGGEAVASWFPYRISM